MCSRDYGRRKIERKARAIEVPPTTPTPISDRKDIAVLETTGRIGNSNPASCNATCALYVAPSIVGVGRGAECEVLETEPGNWTGFVGLRIGSVYCSTQGLDSKVRG